MIQRLVNPASILLALAIIPVGMAFAQNDNGSSVGTVDEAISTEMQALIQIEEFTKQALTNGEIPVSEILDRVGEKWIAKYDSVEDFKSNKIITRDFINSQLEGEGPNRMNAKHLLRLYNFDTITGAAGNGLEISLLGTELQRIQNRYNASEQAREFHTWLATKYHVPNTEQGIKDRLVEILGDEKFLTLVDAYVQSSDKLADNGIVPGDLMAQDRNYWDFILATHGCEQNPECDPELYRNVRNGNHMNNKVDVLYYNDKIWNIIPNAYAAHKIYVPYVLNLGIHIDNCMDDHDRCAAGKLKIIQGRSGKIEISGIDSDRSREGIVHKSGLLVVTGSSCALMPSGINENPTNVIWVIATTSAMERDIRSNFKNNGECAFATTTHRIADQRPEIFGGAATSTGSYYLGAYSP